MEFLDHFDTIDAEAREAAHAARLPGFLAHAVATAPGWARHLAGHDLAAVTGRAALARLPVLRKSDLAALQKADPPFGGLVSREAKIGRLFMSPGPIFDPEGTEENWWNAARALHAAGFRAGDVVLNTFSYNLTPGGFILDSGARALGCPVIAAGPTSADTQVELVAHYRPAGFIGVPDFLKIVLDAAEKAGRPATSITKALVSGAYLPPSLRAEMAARGVRVSQAYATADLGIVAYESKALEGLIVNEDVLVEIVRPGTDEPVADGEVGEVVVTRFDATSPMIRFGTGDLSAILPGLSPCGRTAPRIRGWLGRADQRTKVKGMFVDPAQVETVRRAFAGVGRARLVVARAGEQDEMTLKLEAADAGLGEAVAAKLRDVTNLRGKVEIVPPGSLPNDGKVIDDTRPVG